MPRGDKSAYTEKQKRKAEHIEEGYEDRGVPDKEAERRAWATVNRESGGGKRAFAQALGGAQPSPQGHARPVGYVDADLLHQPRGQGFVGQGQAQARSRQGRIAQGIRANALSPGGGRHWHVSAHEWPRRP